MDFFLTYIFYRFFFRIKDFFHHWYADASRSIFHYFIATLERMDETLAFRVTLSHIFEPLYKDYSIIGRTIGFVFRFARICVGGVIYCLFGIVFLAFYISWLILPFALLALAIKPA